MINPFKRIRKLEHQIENLNWEIAKLNIKREGLNEDRKACWEAQTRLNSEIVSQFQKINDNHKSLINYLKL